MPEPAPAAALEHPRSTSAAAQQSSLEVCAAELAEFRKWVQMLADAHQQEVSKLAHRLEATSLEKVEQRLLKGAGTEGGMQPGPIKILCYAHEILDRPSAARRFRSFRSKKLEQEQAGSHGLRKPLNKPLKEP